MKESGQREKRERKTLGTRGRGGEREREREGTGLFL